MDSLNNWLCVERMLQKSDCNTVAAKAILHDKALALPWIENGPGRMMVTMHHVGLDRTFWQNCKRPRSSSTNGHRVRHAIRSQPFKKTFIPKSVDDYNFYMGSVDIANKLRAV